MSGDAKIWRDLPDVYLTTELCADATIAQRYRSPQCCRSRNGTDVQSDSGEEVRCSNPSTIKICLTTGQYYNLCDEHAHRLGFRDADDRRAK